MSFISQPELQPARATKVQEYKLLNMIKRQLSTYVADAPVTVCIGALMDLTQTEVAEVVPPRPGYYFVALGAWFYSKTTSGVAATAPTLGCGNDVGVTNVVPAIAAPVIAVHAAGAPSAVPLTLGNPLPLIDMSTPILAATTVKATGGVGFAWTGRVHIAGYYALP